VHVLLIEDNESNAYLVRFLLERRGHTVDVAATGATGAAHAATNGYDVILLDLRLPDGDGCDFAQRFTPRGVPVIAVSAHALAADQQRALEVGCAGFIEKPIDVSNFVDTVETIAATRRHRLPA
jgi:two-component system cell cycle response regulator DivK